MGSLKELAYILRKGPFVDLVAKEIVWNIWIVEWLYFQCHFFACSVSNCENWSNDCLLVLCYCRRTYSKAGGGYQNGQTQFGVSRPSGEGLWDVSVFRGDTWSWLWLVSFLSLFRGFAYPSFVVLLLLLLITPSGSRTLYLPFY